jgi:mannosyltransferase OCH1-like enzyme
MIPKRIYIAHKTKEEVIKYSEPLWNNLNPEYPVYAYGNFDCMLFLMSNYGKLHVDIFNYIKDGPIKCDFWRVCILYKMGGVYADADIEPLVPIREILEEGVNFLTAVDYKYEKVNPHLIICTPGHPILKECINIYVDFYIKKKPYGYWAWSITNVMTLVLSRHAGISQFKEGIYKDIQLISEIFPKGGSYNDVYCTYKNRRLLNNRVKNYDVDRHIFINTQNSIHKLPNMGFLHRR